jgi:hypothetical protein
LDIDTLVWESKWKREIQILTSIVYSRKKHNCGHHIGCEKNSACRHKVLTRNSWKQLALLTWKILPSFLSAFARCRSNSFLAVVSCNTYEQNNIKRISNNCAQWCITCWLEHQNCSSVALTHMLLETRSCKSKEPNWEHIYKTSEKSQQWQFVGYMTMSAVITLWGSLKVSDHHLHHKQLWWAAMTTHWFHQLPTEGVCKYIIVYPKFQTNQNTKSVSWVSVAFLEATGRLLHDAGQHWRDIANKTSEYCILFQPATSFVRLSYITF